MTEAQLDLPLEPDKEEWRPVPDYEGRYEVSSHGRVRSWRKGGHGELFRESPHVMKPYTDKEGYSHVNLWKDNKGITRKVAHLVLFSFAGTRQTGRVAAHWDGNPRNNRLDNLRWATVSENRKDARRHGRQPLGEQVYNAKLTLKVAQRIRLQHAQGISQRRLAKQYEVCRDTIWQICTRRRYV